MSIVTEIEAAVPALHRYARSLVTQRQDADDLVQECLVRALSRPPSPSEAGGDGRSIRPWLFTILHNLNVSRWRALQRRGRAVEAAGADVSVGATQEWSAVARDLMRGFECLSAEHRQVLLLVGVEGMEYAQAAAILGVPIGTVMSRLSRARDALRRHVNGAERPLLRRVK